MTYNDQPLLHKRINRAGEQPVGFTRRYGNDQSGTKQYQFNSLGFRGEEFNSGAPKKIFVCGCSYTFGEGLNLEETWSYRFKEKYAAHYGFQLEEVNLLNFGEPAASNDYIVRTILPQCNTIKPDLPIIQFTWINRTEYLFGPDCFRIGPWVLPDNAKESDSQWLREFREIASHYFAFYTDEWSFASALRNILLVQSYCQGHAIPYIYWWMIDWGKSLRQFSENKVCAMLMSLIDLSHFCEIETKDLWNDKAADGMHPGPRAHVTIAHQLFKTYERF